MATNGHDEGGPSGHDEGEPSGHDEGRPKRPGEAGGPRERRRAGLRNALIGLAASAALVSPVLRREPRDGFPLSTYPMFSEHRERELTLVHAVAAFEGGERKPLPPRLLGTEEVLQARSLLRRSVEAGEAPALCARVAERLRAEGPRPAFQAAREVEVRTDTYDVLSYYETRTPARPGVVHARCPI
ncbi:MAG TPA: hypothetical protein VFS43_35925 [Polyangiaceae bacterium]|nr:hypothetical protein [Polyangiaceae bacterium]